MKTLVQMRDEEKGREARKERKKRERRCIVLDRCADSCFLTQNKMVVPHDDQYLKLCFGSRLVT